MNATEKAVEDWLHSLNENHDLDTATGEHLDKLSELFGHSTFQREIYGDDYHIKPNDHC